MKKTEFQIRKWPDKILLKRCQPVTKVDDSVRELLDIMYELMSKNNGIGLAANQVGIDKALVVVGLDNKVFKLVNPKILRKEGTQSIVEGCLSFPGLELKIKRAKKIWVSALNEYGQNIDIEAENLLAVVFQHEIDHINGITFVHRLPVLKRIKVFLELNKQTKQRKG